MTEAMFNPVEDDIKELEDENPFLPRRLDDETDEEYVEKVVGIEMEIGKRSSYTREEIAVKDAVRMYLYKEMKMTDREIGEILDLEDVTIRAWRYKHELESNSSRKPNKKKGSSGCNYYRSEKSKESITNAVLLLMAMRHGRRGNNISVEKVRKFVNQPEL